jgi:hypothetical protein
MAEPTYTVKALDELTWDAFAALVQRTRATRSAPARCPPASCSTVRLSTYEKLGFARDRKIGKHRWVMTRVVEPRS